MALEKLAGMIFGGPLRAFTAIATGISVYRLADTVVELPRNAVVTLILTGYDHAIARPVGLAIDGWNKTLGRYLPDIRATPDYAVLLTLLVGAVVRGIYLARQHRKETGAPVQDITDRGAVLFIVSMLFLLFLGAPLTAFHSSVFFMFEPFRTGFDHQDLPRLMMVIRTVLDLVEFLGRMALAAAALVAVLYSGLYSVIFLIGGLGEKARRVGVLPRRAHAFRPQDAMHQASIAFSEAALSAAGMVVLGAFPSW